MMDDLGRVCSNDTSLKLADVKYLASIFREGSSVLITDQIQVVRLFPTYFDSSLAAEVGREFIMD